MGEEESSKCTTTITTMILPKATMEGGERASEVRAQLPTIKGISSTITTSSTRAMIILNKTINPTTTIQLPPLNKIMTSHLFSSNLQEHHLRLQQKSHMRQYRQYLSSKTRIPRSRVSSQFTGKYTTKEGNKCRMVEELPLFHQGRKSNNHHRKAYFTPLI